MKLSPLQRVVLALRGRVRLRHEKRPGWVAPLPIYAARCERHGLYEDYQHSWNHRLDCPECLGEAWMKAVAFEEYRRMLAELEALGGG